MLDILGSILTSSLLVILFRVYEQYKFPLLPVITFNYWVCVVLGVISIPDITTALASFSVGSLSLAIVQGALFISIFFLIGKGAQTLGVAYTSIICRVSVVMVVLLSWIAFQELLSPSKGIGLIVAMLAIILLNWNELQDKSAQKNLWLALLLFIGNGLIDCVFKGYDVWFKQEVSQRLFSLTVFGTAGLIGTCISIYQLWTKTIIWDKRWIPAGILLGIPNHFSLVFFLAAITTFPGTQVFPANNIGVILFLTLVGVFFYKEKFDTYKLFGLIASIIAILLILGN